MKRKSIVAALAIVLLAGCTIAYGESAKKSIDVFYKDIKIVIDGVEKAPAHEPFIYNGSTYVPLRFVSEALGKKVTWDGPNNKIFISDTGAIVKELKEVFLNKKPYIESNAEGRIRIEDRKIDSITKHNFYLYEARDGKYYFTYALNGQATKLMGDLCGSFDDNSSDTAETIFNFYDENGKLLYKSPILKKGMDPYKFEIAVKGILQVKVEFEVRNVEKIISPGNRGCSGITDLRVLTTDY